MAVLQRFVEKDLINWASENKALDINKTTTTTTTIKYKKLI